MAGGRPQTSPSAQAHDERTLFAVEIVWVALDGGRKVGARNSFEPDHDAAGLHVVESDGEPVQKVEGRAGSGGVVVVELVVLEPFGERGQVRERQHAGGGLQK